MASPHPPGPPPRYNSKDDSPYAGGTYHTEHAPGHQPTASVSAQQTPVYFQTQQYSSSQQHQTQNSIFPTQSPVHDEQWPLLQHQSAPELSNHEITKRMSALGISPEQIALIMQQPPPPNPTPVQQQPPPPLPHRPSASQSSHLESAMQNLSVDSSPQPPPYQPTKLTKADYAHPNYPFNLPKTAPIVLHNHEINDDLSYIVPPESDPSTRLYTQTLESPTQRLRADLVVKHHKQRSPKQERWAGSCDYTAKAPWPRFPWIKWGEWLPEEHTEAFCWWSDVGTLTDDKGKGTLMYWTKDMDRSKTGFLAVFNCRAAPEDFDYDVDKKVTPDPNDRLICKVEMATTRGGVYTISPGIIHTQNQLDEMITIALAIQEKYCFDIACYLHMEKGWDEERIHVARDLGWVPYNVNGWCDKEWRETTGTRESKSAKWKERGKILGSAAKLTGNVVKLGYNINMAMNGQANGGGGC